MKIPMALELVQSAFACPYMASSPKLPGTADLGLTALFSHQQSFYSYYVLHFVSTSWFKRKPDMV